MISHSSSTLPIDALERVKQYLQKLQQEICQSFEEADGSGRFIRDAWARELGGGGVSQVLSQGTVFEKAGVNFSHVSGERLPTSATMLRQGLSDCKFDATGISVVIHPHSPFVPTTHANVRFFTAHKDNAPPIWWFGGGFDLTPYYGFIEDCKHWHHMAKAACLPFGSTLYEDFKKNCDDYFYLKHRNEARGIGGLFYDDYTEGGFEKAFALMQSVAQHFMKGYLPIVDKRKGLSFTADEKAFQLYRRGRYVEFNLIYDRGTLFGLQSGGRTESILMSLPPEVHWQYNWQPKENSPEEKLYTDFLPIRDWLSERNDE